MKNTINYYYNLNIEYLHFYHQRYYFKLWYQDYVLLPFHRNVEELSSLYDLNQELLRKSSNYHQIIKNKDHQIVTVIEGVSYILLRLGNTENRKVSFVDLKNRYSFSSQMYLPLQRFQWVSLWSLKIDYIESQLEHTELDYPDVFLSISYMIGMGENAISYVQNTLLEVKPQWQDQLVVSHRRVKVTDDVFDFYNPLAIVMDHRARDIAEILKSCFLEDHYDLSEIESFLDTQDLSEYGLRLLYGRMLFPSFYFDSYEDLLSHQITEKQLLSFHSRIEEYENYLNDIYYLLKKYANIPPIEWLQNKRI